MGSRRFGEPVRAYLQAVGCRAALILGEKSALVSRETASYMSSLMGPRAPVVEVPEARHHVMLDQPLGFIAALRMLLDSWIRSEPADGRAKSGLVDGRGPILPERRAIPRLMRRHLFFTDSGRWLAVDGDSVITNSVDANGWVSLFALAQCRR
jgi:hypothetical protein